MKADSPGESLLRNPIANVARKWHDSDLPRCLPYGRYLVISGH